MSNRVTLTATQFKNVKSDDEPTYGYRMYDDAGQAYCNIFTKEDVQKDDLDFLKLVWENAGSDEGSMFDFMRQYEKGIFINGSWYDWDEVKDILSD